MAQVPARRGNQGGQMATRREHPLQRLQHDFDVLFNTLWGGRMAPFLSEEMQTQRLWDFDVQENDKEITVRAEMPGFEENEINVQLTKDVLTISAEKEQRGEGEEEYVRFFRSVTLPSGIDAEKVRANYRNGVLELHIPRSPEAQPRHIKVEGQQSAAANKEQPALTDQSKAASEPGNGGQQASKQAGASASAKSNR